MVSACPLCACLWLQLSLACSWFLIARVAAVAATSKFDTEPSYYPSPEDTKSQDAPTWQEVQMQWEEPSFTEMEEAVHS